ncbi:MAG: MFS transporter [Candidatus Firestonebacteria bacterium]
MEEKKIAENPPVKPPDLQLPEPLKKSVFNSFIMEVALVQGLSGITAGVFFTGYLCLFGATNKQIGWITSIPLLANFAAPLYSFFIDRSTNKKKLYFKAVLPYRLLWFFAAAIPFLVYFKVVASPLLFFSAIFAIMSLFVTYSSIVWTSWMGALIPWNQRGYYFGRRTYVANFSAVLLTLFGGWYIDKWNSVNPHFGFGSLFALAAVFGIIALVVQKRIPEVPGTGDASSEASVLDIPKKLWEITKNNNFMRLVLFNTTWAFIMGLTGVFMNVFLIREVKMSYKYIAIFSVVTLFTRLLITGFWGKMMDKYGYKPVMLICGRFLGLIPLLMIFVGWNMWFMVPQSIIAGLFWPGMEVGQFNIMFRLTPRNQRALYLAFNTILTSLVAFIGPVCGGYLIDWMGPVNFKLLFLQIGAFQLLFFAGAVLRNLPVFILRKVEEPKEAAEEHVFGVVRSTIVVGLMEGLGAMRNYMLIPVQRAGEFIDQMREKK